MDLFGRLMVIEVETGVAADSGWRPRRGSVESRAGLRPTFWRDRLLQAAPRFTKGRDILGVFGYIRRWIYSVRSRASDLDSCVAASWWVGDQLRTLEGYPGP